jgi:hypothetical protein
MCLLITAVSLEKLFDIKYVINFRKSIADDSWPYNNLLSIISGLSAKTFSGIKALAASITSKNFLPVLFFLQLINMKNILR